MAWEWKWGSRRVLVEAAESLECVEVPTYRSSRGPLLKTLLSSSCRMDCLYCPLRTGCRFPRERWEPERLARAFLAAYSQGVVRGLFLSSSLYSDPDSVVEEMLEVVELVRRMGYQGYVHLRLMPGTSAHLVRRAAELADRLGLNLEAPSAQAFSEIAPSKGDWVGDLLSKLLYAARIVERPWRVDTQLVLGASGESDWEVLTLVERLVRSGVGVVHFSPYTPVKGTPLAERRRATPYGRARTLYQTWALMALYKMEARDFEPLLDDRGNLPWGARDLKEELARVHPEWFPVDPEEAGYRELVRVPGIGPRAARRILELRERGERITVKALARVLGWRRLRRVLKYLVVPGHGFLGTTS